MHVCTIHVSSSAVSTPAPLTFLHFERTPLHVFELANLDGTQPLRMVISADRGKRSNGEGKRGNGEGKRSNGEGKRCERKAPPRGAPSRRRSRSPSASYKPYSSSKLHRVDHRKDQQHYKNGSEKDYRERDESRRDRDRKRQRDRDLEPRDGIAPSSRSKSADPRPIDAGPGAHKAVAERESDMAAPAPAPARARARARAPAPVPAPAPPDDMNEVEKEGEEMEEEEEEYDSEDDEKVRLIQEKAYQHWLPRLQKFVREVCGDEKPRVVGDREQTVCHVCPTTQRFKGWTALINHADKFKKKRQHQHRGYHRALLEALRVHERQADKIEGGRTLHPEKPDDSIIWPPTVIIADAREESDLPPDIEQRLHHHLQDLKYDKILQVDVPGVCRHLMVFPASEAGYVHAKHLTDKLASHKQGREEWLRLKDPGSPESSSRSRKRRRRLEEDFPVADQVFGYFAKPADMEEIDPQRELLSWSVESKEEKVNVYAKRRKQEQEQDRAKIREESVAVANFTESQKQYQSEKMRVADLLVSEEAELQNLKSRRETLEAAFAKKLAELDEEFTTQLNLFKTRSAEREHDMRQRMLENEAQLQQAQIKRLEEIKALETEVSALQGEVKALEEDSQKSRFEKELEMWAKSQNFAANLRRAEDELLAKARQEEMQLVDQHKLAEVELMKEFGSEKEEVLKKWLEEEETLKKQAEAARTVIKKEAPELPEMSVECAVCLEEFDEEHPRAYMVDCGHARVCLECAMNLFRRKKVGKTCPICRTKLATKPKRYDEIQWS